ncbi:Gcd10p family [Popillia japonica]|uniref:tRNA (adenine(58)-N(1))-methyltransferase non-catalytic subunit TRM6 n=1 Tax=Popillia japonica TaxID=7064 RepID=A0AAW1MJ63_POPJA
MKPKQDSKKMYTLEKVEQLNTISQLNIESSGKDNRNITDDGTSQSLTKEEIIKLKDESLSSADIVGKLINNSKTFSSKTEYSQEKYMKKKEKKYFEYVQFRKPNTSSFVNRLYGLRIDDISQILTYGNIQADGNFILYDSGTSGLMAASILNAIGANTEGSLIHMHPGNECQKNAVLALQFPQEQLERCINVNLYSVLRCFECQKNAVLALQFPQEQLERCINVNLYSVLRCFYQNESSYSEVKHEQKEDCETENIEETTENISTKRKLSSSGGDNENPAKKACWQYDNEKACKVLTNKVDGLVITCKEHPVNIFKELVPFLT